MGLQSQYSIKWIFISAIPSIILAQTITSTLHDGQFACPGEVIFTCVTWGSQIIAWTSEVYIGTDGAQLEFAAGLDDLEKRQNSTINQHTFAVFTRSEVINGLQVLESRLRVMVSLDDPNPSVSCVHVDANNRPNTTAFQVLAEPGEPQDMRAVLMEQCHATEKCVVTSIWRSPNNANEANVTHYNVMISVNGSTVYNGTANISKNNNMISALLPVPNCTEAYQININAVNVCGQGPSAGNFMLDPNTRHNITSICTGSAINNKCSFILVGVVMVIAAILLLGF